MAERSGELDGGTEIRVDKTDAIDKVNNSFDDTDLESSSTAGVADDETSEETDKIRTNIVETRSQMSETIDAIQEKLSFSNLSEQVSNIGEQVKDEVSEHISSAIQTAKDTVYDATLGKVGNVMNFVNKGMNEVADTSVARVAQKNPLAISLIGLGLGLLYMNSSKKRSQYRYKRNENDGDYDRGDYDYDREDSYRTHEFAGKNNQSAFASAQSRLSDTTGKVGETFSDAAGAVSGTVSDVAGKAYKQVGNIGSQVKDVAGSAQDQYEYYIDENPLAVGAVALAIGAAVGMSLPSTRFEGELMGETRDNLMQKAEETARGTIDKVKSVAGEVTEKVKSVAGDVVQTVKDSAGDVAQTVKDNAGDVTQTAKEEAKKQGLT